MKVFNTQQIKGLDARTIEQEPISSIDLMERAAQVFVDWFVLQFPNQEQTIVIFCGPGNNGGDGLAVARMLHRRFYEVQIVKCEIGNGTSPDFRQNWERLPRWNELSTFSLLTNDPFPELSPFSIVIDAIFGSGLNREIESYWADLLQHLNQHPGPRIAIDVPSGLYADAHTSGISFQAQHTLSFELPKLAYFFAENDQRVGQWHIRSIGLDPGFLAAEKTNHYYLDVSTVKAILKTRRKHSHKGTFGHALLICGSHGMMGAAILSARACQRSGVGLLSIHSPKCGYPILQISIPEAMVSVDHHEYQWSDVPVQLEKYAAIGLGCGISNKTSVVAALDKLLQTHQQALVLDADALNIIGAQGWQRRIPNGSILTPHPKEFERLFGPSNNDFERLELQRQQAKKLGVFILLKGAYSCFADPEGNCYFNATGNPGMATGGSGDVLTGILTGLLAQGYTPLQSGILGMYVHGLAGDLASEALEQEALIASDIIDHLGKAFQTLRR
jgi:NAD(P)H-hydrate epimerase